jgi:D-alanyl-lipoteichoic acid acyltransferase DltB (MBOAT superfamily)
MSTTTVLARGAESILPRRLLLLTAQLAGLTFFIHYFYIGGRAFVALSYLALAGFVVNALLAQRYRPVLFLALSIAGIFLVAGPWDGLWLILVVAAFVGVALLRVGFGVRVALLTAAGGGLALMRAQGWAPPWSDPLWPIIASILMFRLMVFVYDTHHEKKRPSLVSTFSYFLLLPNVCFPLFPVVDFKRFRSTYYSEPPEPIYNRGLSWMLRGVAQLLLYRILYQFLTIAPTDVQTAPQLVQYILTSYGLYLRVSGLFHVIVGQLLLFGFNLPETHHRYFFASSFNDFWRRINIYWKDFMLKLFYYPLYFRLKRWGPTVALVIATAVVFMLTWLLHAYQWFWLRGTALFVAHDALFWGILGVAVVFNSLWEIKRGRERVLGEVRPFSYRWTARTGRVIATFTAIAILWSMWSAESLSEWLTMWVTVGPSAAVVPAMIPAGLLLSAWAAGRARAPSARPAAARPAAQPSAARQGFAWPRRRPLFEQALVVGLMSVLIVTERVGAGNDLPDRIDRIRVDRLNIRDQQRQERGYYENLINVNLGARVGLIDEPGTPRDWVTIRESGLLQNRPDFLLAELRPNLDTIFQRARIQTNQWGMRDREYPLAKPEGTVRIAVLGASHVMGTGVANGEPFPDRFEELLNSASGGVRYEVLNFAVAGLGPLNHLFILGEKVAPFEPDVVLYVMMEDIEYFLEAHMVDVVYRGVELPVPYLRDLVTSLSLDPTLPRDTTRARIAPYAAEIEAWAERGMAEAIREMNARPVAMYLPRPQRTTSENVIRRVLGRAHEAGFDTLALRGVYDGYTIQELKVAPWDLHPNPFAHGLIAENMVAAFEGRPDLLSPPGTLPFIQAADADTTGPPAADASESSPAEAEPVTSSSGTRRVPASRNR